MNVNGYESVTYRIPNDIPAGVYDSDVLTDKGYPSTHFEAWQTMPNGERYS